MNRRWYVLAAALALFAVSFPVAADNDGDGRFQVIPRVFDPSGTRLVNSDWEKGTGCPTDAKVVLFDTNPPFDLLPPSRYTDPACPTGDARDRANEGLVLVKTGPTLNNASAVAELRGVRRRAITELGYDIRKPGVNIADPRGSHCGAGAPRFNVVIEGRTYFVGCASPPPTVDQPGIGFQRLRWGGGTPAQPVLAFPAGGVCVAPTTADPSGACDITGVRVERITIVFDEGQDASGAPDQFGAAVLDNIDVNGVLVGQGEGGHGNNDNEHDHD